MVGGGMRPRTASADTGFPGLSGADLRSVQVDPADPSSVIAWGPDSQWRSADGAASWSPIQAGSTLAGLDPTDPGFVYGLVNGHILHCMLDNTGCSVADSPSPAHDLYVTPSGRLWSVEDSDLAYSDDHGTTWTSSTDGLPDTLTWGQVTTLQEAPSDGATYLSLQPAAQGDPSTLWRRDPQSGDWTQLNEPDTYSAGLVVSPTDSGVLYAVTPVAVYRSDDGGLSWTTLMGAVHDPVQASALTIAPSDPQTMYAAIAGA
ncbi:MAG TPA: hypothetical protein VFQ71_12860, partial [Gaiellales bacterium]|nr:hypothetical protein [Gaiellales bacterium]